MAEVVYGSEIAADIKANLKQQITELNKRNERLPRLVVILIGNHAASLSYVKGKERACHEIGMENELIQLSEDIAESELLALIDKLNQDAAVDGILVQLPLPKHINESRVLYAISPEKDVDGFHPYNIGRMMMGKPTFLPCTPKGIMEVLKRISMRELSGKHAVVIGRSNIVGKPIAQLLLAANATVTVTHSKTANIKEITKMADILIVAVGKPRMVDASWIKEGAVVIDVGVNRDENNKLCGDVDFASAESKAAYITPVPKGIGPMTIAMLMSNTLDAYFAHQKSVQE